MPTCFVCSLSLQNLKSFRCHVKLHGVKGIQCMDGCNGKPFSNVSNFCRHFARDHPQLLGVSVHAQHLGTNTVSANQSCNLDNGTDGFAEPHFDPAEQEHQEDEIMEEDSQVLPPPSEELELLKNELDLFIGNMYGNARIPRNGIQSVVDNTDTLINVVHDILKPRFELLAQSSNNAELIDEIRGIFSVLTNPFSGIHSDYMRMKKYTEEGTYIPPESIEIGQFESTSTSRCHSIVPVKMMAHHIPLRSLLKAFLQQKGIFTIIFKYRQFLLENPDVYLNFMSGKAWKKFKNLDKFVLPLFLFGDEFDPANMGSDRSGLHKLTGFYVCMPFLPPEYFSKLEYIFVVYMFHSADRKAVNMKAEVLYGRLVDEFKFLINEGITVATEEYTGQVYFSLSLLIGDNLGLHQVSGFNESFSSNYPCIHCKVRIDVMVSQCREDVTLRRTVRSYRRDLARNNPSLTGIKEPCAFNEVPLFHCIGNTGFDIMHDLFEGACHYDLSVVIDYFLEHNYFESAFLNNRIQFFNYGLIDQASKPPLLTFDKNTVKFKISASGMMVLCKYFGLLVGDLIPRDNPVWQLYIVLRKIIDIVMCPHIHKSKLDLLNDLVQEHHELYLKWSTDKRLKNKHHNMLHFSWAIEKFGPLVYEWCMKMEAKNKVEKLIATSVCTKVNLTLSVTRRTQLGFHALLKRNAFSESDVACGTAKVCNIEQLDFYPSIAASIPPEISEVELVSWVTVKSIDYKKKMILIVGCDEFLPSFAQIQQIVKHSDRVFFFCSKLRTEYFDMHYYCYKVTLTDTYSFVEHAHLPHIFPTALSSAPSGTLFVTYRYGL